jgi:HAD superfamily hydrolase (TIGR01509 family)
MYEAVVFDWDGTLADTRRVIVASFQKALSQIGCNISDEFIEQRIGIGSAETFREILRSSGTSFDEALIKRLVVMKVRNEIELGGNVRLFGGAVELLRSLHGKVKLGLASMSDRAVIDHMLKLTGTQRFFAAVVTADEVVNPKPSPEIFLKCGGKLGARPERCVVVEDSVFGVEAAKAAKMKCIVVLTGVHSREVLEKAKPDLVVKSFKEKSEILNFIFQ